MYIWNIIGKIADLLAILSIWGVGEDGSVAIKVILSILIIVVLIISSVLAIHKNRVVDYYWVDEEMPTLFMPSFTKLRENILVSIYKDGAPDPLAIGEARKDESTNRYQIRVIRFKDEKCMKGMKQKKNAYKQFYVLPYVRSIDINGLNLLDN